MNIITDLNFFGFAQDTFKVLKSQTKDNSPVIEFLNDLYVYPPKFKIKWTLISNLKNDFFVYYNFRAFSQTPDLKNIINATNKEESKNQIINKNESSLVNYIRDNYNNKTLTTNFYNKQTYLIQTALKTVPVYTILNGTKKIFLANSTHQHHSLSVTTNLLCNVFGNVDLITGRNSKLGLFFLSKKDAEQYLNEIAKFDSESTKMFGLSIHCFGLDSAYRIMREYHPGIDFRIIPDFSELAKSYTFESTLLNSNREKITKFRSTLLLVCHFLNQSLSLLQTSNKNNVIVGTPIYVVKTENLEKAYSIESDNTNTNIRIKEESKPKFESSQIDTYIFFEKKRAIKFCNFLNRKILISKFNSVFKFNNRKKKLLTKSQIKFYNLEDFLELWEDHLLKENLTLFNNNNKRSHNFDMGLIHFIPSEQNCYTSEGFENRIKMTFMKNFQDQIKQKIYWIQGFLKIILNNN